MRHCTDVVLPHMRIQPVLYRNIAKYSKGSRHFNMSNRVLLIGILFTAILSLNGQLPSNAYQNFNNKTRTWNIGNLVQLGIESLSFLWEGQRFLEEEVPDMTPQLGTMYDFIIVGAGTAGATLAARLSEVPQAKVLLIEAGYHENFFMDVPLLTYFLQLGDDINWKSRTKSSKKYCLGMTDNRCNWPSGKVLGGSSVLNYMIATRGGAEDYDRWAKMGNEGWAYKDVLKYFKKLETINVPKLQSDITYHGTKGPLHVSSSTYRTPLAEMFLRAGQELGYPIVDYNGKNMIGFSYVQSTTMNGTRMSSNRAYLHPIRHRKNLHVSLQSTVKKVLIDRRTNRAIGVKFTKHGRIISVFASKEVILYAGAIMSPQLLMLSGVGPSNHLTDLGIDVVYDAPFVGENLMDHVAYGGLTWMVNDSTSLRLQDVINPAYPYISDFLTRRSGPGVIPGACEALGFINTKRPKERSSLADIEFMFFGGTIKGDPILPIIMGFNDKVHDIWCKHRGKYGWATLPMLLKPKSRGRIRLLANDINVKPEITPNYFDDPEDVKTMIVGIKNAISIGQTKTMQAFGSELLNDTLPGCEKYEYDSYAYWECAVRTLSCPTYHYSGTCKMGPKGDATAVVDPELKVIGVQRLRIADASIMPEIISGHINLPVYMIAEKAADIIKEKWGY
ncbi:glucose dehydrogenase [FAD, quinone]-like [Linepithema humile]|uniref:glucose dehydrogenase [FAD, quinone]-like n=1 Tax=Linepithema humile TaxID=83485 RepID=UPI00351EE1D1